MASYQEQRCRLDPGDLLVLYSDGVTEASNAEQEEFGDERFAKMVAELRGEPAQAAIAKVNQAITDFVAGASQSDDITLVVARRTPGRFP